MNGNILLVIPLADYDNTLPKILGQRYSWMETNEDETQTEKIPSWRELGERNRPKFGDPRAVHWIDDKHYMVLEFEASWIEGEVTEITELRGQDLEDTDPAYAKLTHNEFLAYMQQLTKYRQENG